MFPDPIAFSIGPFAIKWYGLAYVFGTFLAWAYGRRCILLGYFPKVSPSDWDNLMNRVMLGMILGGRLGYYILYSPETFATDPIEILQIWHPGMAFHGGLVGVIIAVWIYARQRSLDVGALMDVAAVSTPIGLFLGRLANFVNQEHCGHRTDLPWGVVFPSLPDGPRHPSQLYEAALEGILLFLILAVFMHLKHNPSRGNQTTIHSCTMDSPVNPTLPINSKLRTSASPSTTLMPILSHSGQLSGIFLMGYGTMRCFGSYFRIPDGLWNGITLGQWYSIPCIIFGLIFYLRSSKV